MESYPAELLVGVPPLIFCVDATVEKGNVNPNSAAAAAETGANSSTPEDEDTADVAHDNSEKKRTSTLSSSNRSQFDKFLDAMAASLMADPADEYGDPQSDFPGGVTPQRTKSFDSVGNPKEGPIMSHPLSSLGGSGGGGGHGDHNNPLKSLFRGDEPDDIDSDREDDLILGSSTPTTARHSTEGGSGAVYDANSNNNISFFGGNNRRDSRDRQQNSRPSLPKINLPKMGTNDNRNSNFGGAATVAGNSAFTSTASNSGGGNISLDPSFAHALQQGQSFFQRARIVSISSRHGFPPSKDPTGQRNRIEAYFDNTQASGPLKTSKLVAATQQRPIDGIIPSGWLEKHAAALPSVILVVVQIDSDTITQSQQDQLLTDTIENLQHSLAPKRQVLIQVVGLIQKGVSQSSAEEWARSMTGKLAASSSTPISDQQNYFKPIVGVGGTGASDSPPQPVILLPVSDLQPDASYSFVMQQLYERVRNASFEYYWNRCKDAKQKLCRLGPARRTPLLLPLSIRYCFKVAMFYEFQWKQEKSLKYMLEAYRLLEMYFRYLLQQREVAQDNDDEISEVGTSTRDDNNYTRTESTYSNTKTMSDDKGEGVELTISTSNKNIRASGTDDTNMLLLQTAPPADDMIYQCRAVADWLNFKILQQGLVSNTEGGMIIASTQMQRHALAFCSPNRSFVNLPSAPWLDWLFVSQQWLVMSQLLERHPPRVVGDLGGDNDEVLIRCSAWRAYESAASSLLRAGKFLQSCKDTKLEDLQLGKSSKNGKRDDIVRTRYVGGIDNDEGFSIVLEEELKFNHKEQALSCTTRGLSLLQTENTQLYESNSQMHIWSRASTRLHYLAAGTLMSMDRYSEAMPHIVEAVKRCSGWSGLEMITRKMLIACFQKMTKESIVNFDNADELLSLMMDSLFAGMLDAEDLQSFLEKLSSSIGSGSESILKWEKECVDEGDQRLPFSFFATFPDATHVTAGDEIEVCLWIRSNLDFPTAVYSVVLFSSIGNIEIPTPDLLNAATASSDQDGSILIQANQSIMVSTTSYLPSNVFDIVEDGTSIGGENKSSTSNNYGKTARPRTSGITAAAGARFASEDKPGNDDARRNAHWSHVCLGGRSLSCDGIQISFYPASCTSTASVDKSKIELVIKKVDPKKDIHVKRTPFEEENYIASVWDRPIFIPLNQGPRCIRALNPTATMIIFNLTERSTNGRTLEGTVNRIVLKLIACDDDNCTDMKVLIKSSSFLLAADGTSKSIAVIDDDNLLLDNSIDITHPRVRTPVMVVPSKNPLSQFSSGLGYDLPVGWELFGKNGQGDSICSLNMKDLKAGESTYIYFDIFRPTSSPSYEKSTEPNICDTADLVNRMCRTDVDVSVTYNQTRKNHSKSSDVDGTSVTLFEKVQMLWSAPINVDFCPAWKDAYPSGNRHPSNFVTDVATGNMPSIDPSQELVLIDKEKVLMRCTIEAIAPADGLQVVIDEVRFANTSDQNSPCSFDLLSGLDDENGIIYIGSEGDIGRELGVGSKFVISWAARANMQSAYLKGSVTSALGELIVHWRPPPLHLPEGVVLFDVNSNEILTHGPLPLDKSSTSRFEGPACYIENSPFEACADPIPATIRLSEAFDVTYSITNKTPLDQQLDVQLMKSGGGFLISGLMNGTVDLGPFEKYKVSFTVVPTRIGELALPVVSVSSKRYQTWVIQEASSNRFVFVIP